MKTLQQRILVSLTAAVVAALCGALLGYLAGRALILHLTERRLTREAEQILVVEEAGAAESRAVLAAINASPYPGCSDADLNLVRKLLFQAKYLKDSGRMQNGKILCSASESGNELPTQQFRPDFVRRDGTRVYRNLPPFQIAGYTVITVELGGSFIVYNPYHEEAVQASFSPYMVTETDMPTRRVAPVDGGILNAPVSILTQDGQSTFGSTMYATLCSHRFTSCITAYQTVPQALMTNWGALAGYVALGAALGSLAGLLAAFAYQRSRSLEQQLRRALRQNRVRMVYQPIVQLSTGSVVGAEALARWTNEDEEAISPETFIRLAEEHGFVGELTRVALHNSLEDMGLLLRSNPQFSLSVNISALDLRDPAFLPMLEAALAREAVSARSIVIEITERSTANHAEAIEAIRSLRQLGFHVHIDDFGTGYSSLSYLHDLDVDAIKIDRSFTQSIGTEAVTVGILPQMLSMAASLHLQVVVEGVETVEQAAYFSAHDLPIQAQGWFYGRPVPVAEFLRRMSTERSPEERAVAGKHASAD